MASLTGPLSGLVGERREGPTERCVNEPYFFDILYFNHMEQKIGSSKGILDLFMATCNNLKRIPNFYWELDVQCVGGQTVVYLISIYA